MAATAAAAWPGRAHAGLCIFCFALSDCLRDGRVWDNNSNKDFHSPVEAAATSDSMVEMVFQVKQ